MSNNVTRNNILQSLLVISMLCLFTLLAHAVVPDNINYQGYLTDSTAAPSTAA